MAVPKAALTFGRYVWKCTARLNDFTRILATRD